MGFCWLRGIGVVNQHAVRPEQLLHIAGNTQHSVCPRAPIAGNTSRTRDSQPQCADTGHVHLDHSERLHILHQIGAEQLAPVTGHGKDRVRHRDVVGAQRDDHADSRGELGKTVPGDVKLHITAEIIVAGVHSDAFGIHQQIRGVYGLSGVVVPVTRDLRPGEGVGGLPRKVGYVGVAVLQRVRLIVGIRSGDRQSQPEHS